MVTLIICEKPTAADKIAHSLGHAKKHKEYYEVERKGKKLYVVPAVGHLLGLKPVEKHPHYPVFKLHWEPSFLDKNRLYAKKYYMHFEKLSKKADEFIVACDYDVEGSVIGRNILKYICNKKDAKRMKFSTLTKKELEESYENASPRLDFGLVESGVCRHYLDWFWGVNLSRVLTDAIKGGKPVFEVLSIGRVQGPMLYLIAKREREIKAFKPEKYWQILLKWDSQEALYIDDIKDEKIAKDVIKSCKNKEAVISDVKKVKSNVKAPFPFDLTSLQVEAHNLFGYSPKQILSMAQSLYTKAYISYPRTSSQKLPDTLGLQEIITALSKQEKYEKFCDGLVNKKPNEGKKTDPAHPAIHPTGEIPESLDQYEKKIYDLIVRRFLSCFGDDAIRESVRIKMDVDGNQFKSSGSRTLEPGWIEIYGEYAKYEEKTFPDLKKGDKIEVKSLEKLDKETKPPNRYTQASILHTLDKENIGTKATRANILQTLYNRNYIINKSLEITDLGMRLIETLEKYCPTIISEKMTREFEQYMDDIYNKRIERDTVLKKAEKIITGVVEKLETHKEDIGLALDNALIKTRDEQRILGKCGKCGNNLKILFSHKGSRFVGCTGYPKCHNMYPLPHSGFIKKTDKVCEKCGTPIIYVFRKGKRPFKMCLDTECETKKGWKKHSDKPAQKASK
jgi:DNA topoisomerase-1